MGVPQTSAWQTRRSVLNHDRLANRFLPALHKWLRILDGAVIDAGFAESFPEKAITEWKDLRYDILDLIRSYTDEMSPRSLFRMLLARSLCEAALFAPNYSHPLASPI